MSGEELAWWERSFLVHCLWRWTGALVIDVGKILKKGLYKSRYL